MKNMLASYTNTSSTTLLLFINFLLTAQHALDVFFTHVSAQFHVITVEVRDGADRSRPKFSTRQRLFETGHHATLAPVQANGARSKDHGNGSKQTPHAIGNHSLRLAVKVAPPVTVAALCWTEEALRTVSIATTGPPPERDSSMRSSKSRRPNMSQGPLSSSTVHVNERPASQLPTTIPMSRSPVILSTSSRVPGQQKKIACSGA